MAMQGDMEDMGFGRLCFVHHGELEQSPRREHFREWCYFGGQSKGNLLQPATLGVEVMREKRRVFLK